MAEIKKISTEFQLLDKFLDTSGDAGSANQVLVSTTTGINWVDGSGSGIIGGPYLPLTAGSTVPLSGDLYINNATYIRNTDSNGAVPRTFGFNSSNNMYIGPIDSYAGGAVFYGVSANVASHTLYTGGSARMIINSSGNVGIGTTSPGKHITVRRYNNSTNVFAGFYALNESQGLEIGYAGIYSGGTNADVDMNIQAKGTGNILMTGSGKVGIGTTSPLSSLHVSGTAGNRFTEGLRVERSTVPAQFAMFNYNGGSLNIIATNTAGT